MKRELKQYIPANLDLDEILSKNPPTFKYNKDSFIHILSLISEIPSYNKGILDKGSYTPLYSRILQPRIKTYNLYLNYLVAHGVLEADNHYIPEKKSKGYKFTEKYRVPVVASSISRYTLVKQIRKGIDLAYKCPRKYNYLTKWFNPKLSVDYKSASALLNYEYKENLSNGTEDPERKYNAGVINIERLKDQRYSLTVDNNVGRFHSNLTNIKKNLRNFISYDNTDLVSVDIKNSQPFLSTALLNPDFYIEQKKSEKLNIYTTTPQPILQYITPQIPQIQSYIMSAKSSTTHGISDLERYKELVIEGQLYEYMAENIGKMTNVDLAMNFDRQAMKNIVFTVLFSDNNWWYLKEGQPKWLFRELFPSVCEVFRLIKLKDYTVLPRLLQRMEATLMLDKVAKRVSIEHPPMPIYTIHDSIAGPVGTEDYLSEIIKKEAHKALLAEPSIAREHWTPANLNNAL